MGAPDTVEVTSAPCVLISYSWDSETHKKRVLALADRLRKDGVDARIDRYYEVPPPPSWPQWMHDQIEDADYIIVVATELYNERVRNHQAPRTGRGSLWEGMILIQDVYDHDNHRVIPVVFETADVACIPTFLKPTSRYDLSQGSSYNQLLRHVFNRPEYVMEPIGEPPDFITSGASQRQLSTTSIKVEVLQNLNKAVALALDVQEETGLEPNLSLLRTSLSFFAAAMDEVTGRCVSPMIFLVRKQEPEEGVVDTARQLVVSNFLSRDGQAPGSVEMPLVDTDMKYAVMMSPQPALVSDFRAEEGYLNSHWQEQLDEPRRSVVAWPIARESNSGQGTQSVVGVLCLYANEPNVFNEMRDFPLGTLYSSVLYDALLKAQSPTHER